VDSPFSLRGTDFRKDEKNRNERIVRRGKSRPSDFHMSITRGLFWVELAGYESQKQEQG